VNLFVTTDKLVFLLICFPKESSCQSNRAAFQVGDVAIEADILDFLPELT